ncbi:hypothetical protein HYPSUDRAFT_204820 [Hypholoma sublateritium FD-334 SS-4]|uniref:DUF6534 domain-containing protein n=1 Tax=Hypholoma sublateritium (strain FD-334 SS-4) TaxID=945553 RepID=A0A0D2KWU7_HYPSF|nr:hypothetical protein HYPSUDRAFT_204820 [Hypholoma sublateritium FD-334 SS-4]
MDNATLPAPIPPDIVATTSPLLIGTLINWALYGVLSCQTYVYHINFPDDRLWNKALVYGCYIFEVVQTAMTAADLYFWFGTGYGNLARLGEVNISPADTPIFCGIIAAVVQCFFAYRIFTLQNSYRWVCLLIVLTSVVQTGGALATGIRAFKLQEYARLHDNVLFPQAFNVWLIGDTVCDTLIAGAMLLLFHQSRDGGIGHGTRILGQVVCLIVETNALTAGMALVSFICYVVLPNSNMFVCTTLVMGKLCDFSISLLTEIAE